MHLNSLNSSASKSHCGTVYVGLLWVIVRLEYSPQPTYLLLFHTGGHQTKVQDICTIYQHNLSKKNSQKLSVLHCDIYKWTSRVAIKVDLTFCLGLTFHSFVKVRLRPTVSSSKLHGLWAIFTFYLAIFFKIQNNNIARFIIKLIIFYKLRLINFFTSPCDHLMCIDSIWWSKEFC